MKGVCLKIRNKGNETAADVINAHYKKMKAEGAVYFSTRLMIKEDRGVQQVLFYFIHHNRARFVTADILSVKTSKTAFVPEDSVKYSLSKRFFVPKKSWLLMKNMREVPQEYIESCNVYYNDGRTRKLLDVIKHPNFNRAYYRKTEK